MVISCFTRAPLYFCWDQTCRCAPQTSEKTTGRVLYSAQGSSDLVNSVWMLLIFHADVVRTVVMEKKKVSLLLSRGGVFPHQPFLTY